MWVEFRTYLMSYEFTVSFHVDYHLSHRLSTSMCIFYRIDLLIMCIHYHADFLSHGFVDNDNLLSCEFSVSWTRYSHGFTIMWIFYPVDFVSHGIAIMWIHSSAQHRYMAWNECLSWNTAFHMPAFSCDCFRLLLYRQVSNCSCGCARCVTLMLMTCFMNVTRTSRCQEEHSRINQRIRNCVFLWLIFFACDLSDLWFMTKM